MATPPFDAAKALRFDLTRGMIANGAGTANVLVPLEALAKLCLAAGTEASASFARALGQTVGAEVGQRLTAGGSEPRRASVDLVLEHLAGEWATLGWGSLSIERWGRALVFVAEHPALAPLQEAWLAELLGAAIGAAAGASCTCVPLVREGHRVRLLVTGARAARRASGWIGQGVSWGEVLVRLHAEAPREVAQ